MRDHTGMIRGFHWANKAHYSEFVETPEVNFGMYDKDDGGTTGEMSMKWIEISGKLYPKLECFDDGWNALYSFSDVLNKLSEIDSKSITDEEFVNILLSCGFVDLTKYKSPRD